MSIELEQPSAPAEFNDYARYRALSALAVVSGVLGVLSASALLDWTLCVLPVVGIITGVVVAALSPMPLTSGGSLSFG